MSNKKPVKVKIIKHEIDYERLENIISNAVNNHDNHVQDTIPTNKKENFYKLVWKIITNKKPPTGKQTAELFGSLLVIVFNCLAVLGAFCAIFGVIGTVVFCINADWSYDVAFSNMVNAILLVAISVLLGLFALLFRSSANELSIEKDRNYIIAVFSGVVSFAALIVALIALVKGVG